MLLIAILPTTFCCGLFLWLKRQEGCITLNFFENSLNYCCFRLFLIHSIFWNINTRIYSNGYSLIANLTTNPSYYCPCVLRKPAMSQVEACDVYDSDKTLSCQAYCWCGANSSFPFLIWSRGKNCVDGPLIPGFQNLSAQVAARNFFLCHLVPCSFSMIMWLIMSDAVWMCQNAICLLWVIHDCWMGQISWMHEGWKFCFQTHAAVKCRRGCTVQFLSVKRHEKFTVRFLNDADFWI